MMKVAEKNILALPFMSEMKKQKADIMDSPMQWHPHYAIDLVGIE
jgi:hypothetical protein